MARVCVLATLAFFAQLLFGVEGATRATLVNNGYKQLVVGISPNIPESEGAKLIPAIKDLIKETSEDIFIATRNRAFFDDVKIVIPISWTNTPIDESAVEEKFLESDIRVDNPHSVYGHQPYAKQMGSCGEPGEYIHITPEYLTDDKVSDLWGSRSKILTMSWAEFRWGVYHEVGFPGDPKYPMFYTLPEEGEEDFRTDASAATLVYEINVCSNDFVEGDEGMIHDYSKPCEFTAEGLPDGNCGYKPDDIQTANSSLMSYPRILSDNIVEFCDHNTHLQGTRTKQNDLCDGMSVWEVMLLHEDFKGNANPATSTYKEPVVKIVQESQANYVLVLDYSGSMDTLDRMEKLQKAAQQFILYDVSLLSSVAIVRFDSNATLLVDLTTIKTDADRQTLANEIHTDNNGGTSIGSGLRMAAEILKGLNNKNILLITDGEENEDPRIADVIDEIVQEKICVITVAFGNKADQGLEDLATQTKCVSYKVNDIDASNAMDTAFYGSTTRQPSESLDNMFIKIYESNKIWTSDAVYSDTFVVDSTIGKEMTFRLKTDDPYLITSSPYLIRPDGTEVYDVKYDNIGQVWTIVVPLAEEGFWKWSVALSQDSSKYIQATVSSLQRNPDDEPFVTTVTFHGSPTGVSPKNHDIKIYATVMKGNNPVIGANVKAIVTSPNESGAPHEYELYDNGKGADAMANDGVYSCYMIKFDGNGRYSIKAVVTGMSDTEVNNGSPKQSPQPSVAGRRRRRSTDQTNGAPPMCCGSVMPLDPTTSTKTGSFTRIASGKSIKIIDSPLPTEDVIKPSKVTDLNVAKVDRLEGGGYVIKLTWTTSGDDLDTGTASNYTFRLSTQRNEVSNEGFDKAPENTLLYFNQDDLEMVMLPFGTHVSFNVTYKGDFEFGKPYFIALKAEDDAGNFSPVSNVEQIFLDEKLDLPPWAGDLVKNLKKNIADFLAQKKP